MKYSLLLIACALPIAACNKGPEVHAENASVEDVAKQVRSATAGQTMIKPGEWQSDTTLEEITAPGMPPQVQEQMKKMMAAQQVHSVKTCVTEADAKKPNEKMFAPKNAQCRYEHFDMSGGKIDAALHCSGQEGHEMSLNVAGTYSPENYDVRMQMASKGGAAAEQMTMKMHTVSHRVGECTSAELAERKQQQQQ